MTKQTSLFVAKFIVLFCVLYAANYAATGILSPGGYYNAWLATNLNYVSALRVVLLKGAQVFVCLFGFDGIANTNYLQIKGATIRIVYSCIGINVLCFWWAFIISFPQTIKRKLSFFPLGTMLIILLNIVRIGMLAMIHSAPGHKHSNIDHHLLFNIILYTFIFFLLTRFIDNSVTAKKQVTRTIV